MQLLGEGPGPADAAHVRGDHHHILALLTELLGVVVHKDRIAVEIIHRDIEKALDLRRVEVHGQHPVGPRRREHIGYQLGGDGVPGLGLPVLAGVAEVGDHRCHPARRGPLHGVNHDQQFHQVVVDRAAGGLNQKHIGAPVRLVDGGVDLAVGEMPDLRSAQLNADELADVLCQPHIGVAAENLHVFPV